MASLGLQRAVVRTLLSLPGPVLRMMSGGGAVYRGGRTLDPRLQFLAAGAKKGPAMESLQPVEARASSAAGFAALSAPLETGVRVSPEMIPGAEGERPSRVYRPDNQDPTNALLVFAHMGGGVIGDLDTCESFCGILARAIQAPVISIDYRLAPEHRFPAGLDDVLAAYRWCRDHADRFGAPTGRAAIGGDSMGGHFASIVCQDLRRAGEAQPDLQLLIYPCVDVASETPSMTTYADAFPLGRATMEWFMGHYLNPTDDPAQLRLSPGRETDLTGLAPAVIATAGFDPLIDQGEAYARQLKAAGVHVEYRAYDSLCHGFTAFTGAVPPAAEACREIAALARDVLQGKQT